MRLLVHNTLRCQRKDVVTGFPLRIQLDGSEGSVEVRETEFEAEFIRHVVPSLQVRDTVSSARRAQSNSRSGARTSS